MGFVYCWFVSMYVTILLLSASVSVGLGAALAFAPPFQALKLYTENAVIFLRKPIHAGGVSYRFLIPTTQLCRPSRFAA